MYCLECGQPLIDKSKPTAKFCSAACRQKGNSKASAKKRGDLQRRKGQNLGYVKLNGEHEHRVVVRQTIGRELLDDEVVHHINGDKQDNRIENLQVLTRSAHARLHATKYAPICIVSGCNNPHRWKGYCEKHRCQIRRKGKITHI